MRRSPADHAGFSTTELLVAALVTTVAVTATSGFFLASNRQLRFQLDGIETSQAARSAADLIARDLRLSGACLPDTGEFIALTGTDGGGQDEIVTRSGAVQPGECVRTSLRQSASSGSKTLLVEQTDDFQPGMRAYLRNASGEGEFIQIASVNATEGVLTADGVLTMSYPRTSGIYALSERRFYISDTSTAVGPARQLMMQVDGGAPTPFAAGIERLDLRYQLARNCPPCDTVDLPNGEGEWSMVQEVFLTVTARAEASDPGSEPYRRTISLGVKPRNLQLR